MRGNGAVFTNSGEGQIAGITSLTKDPVSVPDLFCSICNSLEVNPAKENMSPIGRPMKIFDGGKPVDGLFA